MKNGMGLLIGGKHTFRDFGFWIKQGGRNVGNPQKNKTKVTIPHRDGAYDFSDIYGGSTWGERVIEYTFETIEYSKERLLLKSTIFKTWLESLGKIKIQDDAIVGLYFYGDCTNILPKDDGLICEMTVQFTCEPFLYGNQLEGSDIWDDFLFDIDYFQETTFNVTEGSLDIVLYNPSVHKVVPVFNCSRTMAIEKGGIRFNINGSNASDPRMYLDIGKNNLTILNNGVMEIKFRKELL